jgi:hypothetical protein
MAAARKRQEALKTVEFAFSRTDVAMPARYTIPGLADPKKPAKLIPEKETVVESKDNRVIFDGVRGRLENRHPMWHGQTGKLLLSTLIGVTDGVTEKSHLQQPREGEKDSSIGKIGRSGTFSELAHEILLPFAFHCRPLDPQFCPTPLTDFVSAGKAETVSGMPCELYRTKDTGANGWEVWLDPKRDYIVVRLRHLLNGKVAMDTHVFYDQSNGGMWLPSHWKITQYGHEAVQSIFRTSTVRIESCLVQKEYPQDLFDIVYPPGSIVDDERDQKLYESTPNGELREWDRYRSARGASAAQGTWWYRNRWLLIASGLLALCGIAWFMVRRRQSE